MLRTALTAGPLPAPSGPAAVMPLLIGLLFAYLYNVLASLGDVALFTSGTDGTVAIRLYFSFTTLTTVGYGDYATATSLGHAASVTEAVVGQLYLVTVVAVIVGAMARGRADTRPS